MSATLPPNGKRMGKLSGLSTGPTGGPIILPSRSRSTSCVSRGWTATRIGA